MYCSNKPKLGADFQSIVCQLMSFSVHKTIKQICGNFI